MKKIIYIMLIIITVLLWISAKKENVLPKESIRFRIIANSNNTIDQSTKMLIKKDLEKDLFTIIEDSKSIEETRKLIKENENVIKNILDKYNVAYTINYGQNYFPEKNYKGIVYEEGEYESLVITLGEGAGNNWWCVMYPPLCLLESTADDSNIEYEFYIEKIISQLTT